MGSSEFWIRMDIRIKDEMWMYELHGDNSESDLKRYRTLEQMSEFVAKRVKIALATQMGFRNLADKYRQGGAR